MHRHRTRRMAAAAAGVIAALLVGAAGASAAAAPAYLDPSASPTTDPGSPSPTPTDPSPPATASPTTPDPSSTSPSPSPSYDMSLTGSSAKGAVGGTVEGAVMVHTAGAPGYELALPIRWGNVQYVGRCDSYENQNWCRVNFTSEDSVDTRVLKYKITAPGTTQVPVQVFAKGGIDPNSDNDHAYLTITNGLPGNPYDVSVVSATDETGRVGEVVTVAFTIRLDQAPRYDVWVEVPKDSSVEYVGRCDRRLDFGNSTQCQELGRERKGAVETVSLKFKIVKTGTVKLTVSAWPGDLLEDPDRYNNTAEPSITGLPAAGGGGGNGDDGDALPTTGSPVVTVALAGTALLAAGLILFFVARRRRATS